MHASVDVPTVRPSAVTDAGAQRDGLQPLPSARGPLSHHVLDRLVRGPASTAMRLVPSDGFDDEQLSLFVLQQLSYRPFEGVDPAWEESAGLVAVRNRLESDLEARLRTEICIPDVEAREIRDALDALIADASGRSLSRWMLEHGTIDHLREFVVHRSAYQLQEADPHSCAIPRLEAGVAKTALLQLQMDEYGGLEPTEAHAVLFANTMVAVGLDPVVDLDLLPAPTLATNTLLNRLGRSRRLLPACLGHLAVFEMTSVTPMARYAATVRRLVEGDRGTAAARFYDVHVAADGLHAKLASERLIGGFVEAHPDEAAEVLFGAAALMAVERAFAEHLIACWESGTTSLRKPLPGSSLCTQAQVCCERAS